MIFSEIINVGEEWIDHQSWLETKDARGGRLLNPRGKCFISSTMIRSRGVIASFTCPPLHPRPIKPGQYLELLPKPFLICILLFFHLPSKVMQTCAHKAAGANAGMWGDFILLLILSWSVVLNVFPPYCVLIIALHYLSISGTWVQTVLWFGFCDTHTYADRSTNPFAPLGPRSVTLLLYKSPFQEGWVVSPLVNQTFLLQKGRLVTPNKAWLFYKKERNNSAVNWKASAQLQRTQFTNWIRSVVSEDDSCTSRCTCQCAHCDCNSLSASEGDIYELQIMWNTSPNVDI